MDLAHVNQIDAQARNSGVALGGKCPFFGSSPFGEALKKVATESFRESRLQRLGR